MDPDKVRSLRALVGLRSHVHIHEGDCNAIMLRDVLPRIRYEDFRRGLVFLDPYGLNLNWDVVHAAGRSGTVDLFLNFPLMDMNRNVLWERPEGVDAVDIARMTAFWGDESWRDAAYTPIRDLFGEESLQRTRHHQVVDAYCKRLRSVAGFSHVATPLPMRNSSNSVVYYLLFASQNETAGNIIEDIYRRYRERGV